MNKYHNGKARGGKGAPTGSNVGRPAASAPGFPMKVGFPSAQLPGKAQPPGREKGAKGGDCCKNYPDSKGM